MLTTAAPCQVIWKRSESPIIQEHKIFKSTISHSRKAILVGIIAAYFKGLFTVRVHPGWKGISIWIWGQPHTVFTQLMALNPCYHLKWSLIFSSHICFISSRWELERNLTSALFLIKPLRGDDINVLEYSFVPELKAMIGRFKPMRSRTSEAHINMKI